MKSVNIIDILVSNHDHEIFHSRVLAWLLDPQGSHGFGRTFLDAFRETAFPGWNLGEVEQVKPELLLDTKSSPDIGVITTDAVLLIENKIRFSAITEGQVERYLIVAREVAGTKEVRLAFLLPGHRKSYPQLEKPDKAINTIFWSEVADILENLLQGGAGNEQSLSSLLMYHDYICRTHAVGARAVGLTPGHPRFSPNRSGLTGSLSSSRIEFLKEARERCKENPERLDRIHALVGFLETFDLLRVEYKEGKSNWSITGSIPRSDGGVTLIVGMYAQGKIWYEYRRLTDDLANEYRGLTKGDPEKGWRETMIGELPLEQTLKAIRVIAEKASGMELPVVR
ncbi:MAG: PD-(D/E)XK nuclease family protein [Planctomycetes bacterium]|nr:PD-(D/E)XK nuclease family protein [Planctomycetota bacterium]